MYIENQFLLNKNLLLKRYLREHSYYYKYLNRDPSFINNLIGESKTFYKQTFGDKLNTVKENINMINSFLDIMN